jgi:hypothetical protein
VDEVVPAGWTSSATSHDFGTVNSGGSYSFTFTNFKLGKISGYKFNDLNGNGAWDSGEPALSGWTITLTGPVSGSKVTDSSGYYEFTGLTVGTYTVSETLQTGWTQTMPATPGTYTVVIASGSDVKERNFGNFKPGKIVTRTQGFWATHLTCTWSVWFTVGNKTIGTKVIDDQAKLFGAFWSGIAFTTDGTKRTSSDQARMQLLQQLVAAMLNVKAFGDDYLGTGASLIAAGKAAFAGTDRTAILISANLLAAFNNSGDSEPLPPGVIPGPADPKGAQTIANKAFWNNLS